MQEQNKTKLSNSGKERKQKWKVVERPHYGQSTTNLYPVNAREVSPRSRDLLWVWFGRGGKMAYFQYLAKAYFGKCFAGIASLPKYK